MNAPAVPKITFWRAVFAVLMLAGAYATYLRARYGLGGVTNLNDQFPWGIWIGFDILCGVGLAAGGFTLVAIVHIFNVERFSRSSGRRFLRHSSVMCWWWWRCCSTWGGRTGSGTRWCCGIRTRSCSKWPGA